MSHFVLWGWLTDVGRQGRPRRGSACLPRAHGLFLESLRFEGLVPKQKP